MRVQAESEWALFCFYTQPIINCWAEWTQQDKPSNTNGKNSEQEYSLKRNIILFVTETRCLCLGTDFFLLSLSLNFCPILQPKNQIASEMEKNSQRRANGLVRCEWISEWVNSQMKRRMRMASPPKLTQVYYVILRQCKKKNDLCNDFNWVPYKML